jgi:hypothetical protein
MSMSDTDFTFKECPSCGSRVWDNREKVAGGWNGPLWKCRDECGWVKWPPRAGKKGDNGRPETDTPQSGGRAPKWTWPTLSLTYERCLKLAIKHAALVPKALPADIVAMAATLFIAASRDGIAPHPAPKPPKPEPVPEKEPEGLDDEEPLPF